jgi:4-hydroxy-tetrahydrodipicolinate reductase
MHMTPAAVRVAVAGARGKMGTVAIAALKTAPDMSFVGGLVRAGAATGGSVRDEFDDLDALLASARPEVLVDFTHFPDSKQIALACIRAGVRPVIGTSGYIDDDIEDLRAACERETIGCIFVPNFGVGAVLMMRFAAEAARHYDAVEIVEMHEAGKKDAPSGTSTATARRLAAARAASDAGPFRRAPTAITKLEGARGAEIDGIGIHSLRLPGVVTHQEVLFGADGETLRITHDSTSRASFMPGMLLAIRAARDLTTFVDGLETLL